MGCICECHKTFVRIDGIRGACWECEKEHDPLRNANNRINVLEVENAALKEVLKAAKDIENRLCGRSDPILFTSWELLASAIDYYDDTMGESRGK